MAPFLHLAHVNVARGDNVVLHDINLSVNTGEHIAILGPNGCGKSTLIKTITCECYPIAKPETTVSIFGRERWDLTELKKRLGVVSPELPGRPTLHTTGRDAVLTGFFSSSTLWPNLTVTDSMQARADEVLAQVDAVALADKPVGEMSAGQQRRIMIGRALVAPRRGCCFWTNPQMPLISPRRPISAPYSKNSPRRARGFCSLPITSPTYSPRSTASFSCAKAASSPMAPRSRLLTPETLSNLFKTEVHMTERGGFHHAW